MDDTQTAIQPIELTLSHDTSKTLKGGKRRYSDADGHNIYLQGDEVDHLDAPDRIKIQVTPA